jgi:hypothetical protein
MVSTSGKRVGTRGLDLKAGCGLSAGGAFVCANKLRPGSAVIRRIRAVRICDTYGPPDA